MNIKGIFIVGYVFLLMAIAGVLYIFRPSDELILATKTKVQAIINTPTPTLTPSPTPTLTPTPTPFIFTSYQPPAIERKEVYKIAMVGDSMTAALGPHGGQMSEYMNGLYKSDQNSQAVIIDNFAISSNILAINKQINEKVTISEYTLGPFISEEYDLLIVESFGYNPLSEFGIEEGIKKQNMELTNLLTNLVQKKPKMAIVFVATIAPDILNYAKSTQPNTTAASRRTQAEERIAYLKNHINYANSHNIPLVNIYEKSLIANGGGNPIYVNPNDNIHPSFVGVEFIGREIANYIFENNILPR